MPLFAIAAVGADRPGIVARVTGVLVQQGCNLEDSSMSILRGHFAIMLVVAGPTGLDAASLEAALAVTAEEMDLAVVVREIDEAVPSSPEGEPWTVAVYGSDRPGIVHGVTDLLARAGVNIVDLATRVIGDPDRPVYAMLLEVTVPPDVEAADLGRRLKGLAGELGVECSMHRSEVDIL